MFVRTSREVEGSNDFVEQYSVDYDVMDAGWEVLLAVIRDARWTGQFLPDLFYEGQQVDIVNYLGAGVCSRVWQGQIQPSQGTATAAQWRQPVKIVCKTFTDEQMFMTELSTWEEIARRRALLVSTSPSSSPVESPTQLTYKSNWRRPSSSPTPRSHSLPSRLPSSSSSSSSSLASQSIIPAASSPPTRSLHLPYCLFFLR